MASLHSGALCSRLQPAVRSLTCTLSRSTPSRHTDACWSSRTPCGKALISNTPFVTTHRGLHRSESWHCLCLKRLLGQGVCSVQADWPTLLLKLFWQCCRSCVVQAQPNKKGPEKTVKVYCAKCQEQLYKYKKVRLDCLRSMHIIKQPF